MKKRRPQLDLTELHVDILSLVHEYRVLRVNHLQALAGLSYKQAQRRLKELADGDYLAKRSFHFQKDYHFLLRGAAQVLVEHGLAPKEELSKRRRHSERSPLFLPHDLMVVDTHVALAVACRRAPVELITWTEGPALHDEAHAPEEGERYPIRPDAFFTLRDARLPEDRGYAHFFLEAQRKGEPRDFRKKLVGYQHYMDAHGHRAKHRIPGFRVVTVTPTPERAEAYLRAVEDALPQKVQKFYLFSSLEDFGPDNPAAVFESVFRTPRDWREGARRSILRQPVEEAQPKSGHQPLPQSSAYLQ